MEEKDLQRLLDMLYGMVDEAKSAPFSAWSKNRFFRLILPSVRMSRKRRAFPLSACPPSLLVSPIAAEAVSVTSMRYSSSRSISSKHAVN